MMNVWQGLQAPELFERFSNSPEFTDTLSNIFDEDEEERKRRRMALIGNYNQQSQAPNPQVNLGYQERTPNLFNMFYY